MTINRKPGLKAIVHINMRFVGAVIALAYGWLCWELMSPQLWGLGIAAFLGLFGGGAAMIGIFIEIIRLVLRERKIAKFERQGGKPRADGLVSNDELRARGIIR